MQMKFLISLSWLVWLLCMAHALRACLSSSHHWTGIYCVQLIQVLAWVNSGSLLSQYPKQVPSNYKCVKGIQLKGNLYQFRSDHKRLLYVFAPMHLEPFANQEMK